MLPTAAQSKELNRVVVAYFASTSLDIINEMNYEDEAVSKRFVDWLYGMQLTPDTEDGVHDNCGFRGGDFYGAPFDSSGGCCDHVDTYDYSHVTMTAMSLILLIMFGEEGLERVNCKAVAHGIGKLVSEDGAVKYLPVSTETDLRFMYSLCVSLYILDDWSTVDKDKLIDYVLRCKVCVVFGIDFRTMMVRIVWNLVWSHMLLLVILLWRVCGCWVMIWSRL